MAGSSALRVKSLANAGAYLVSAGGVQTFQYVHLPGTVYRIPAIDLQVAVVLTNTTPIGVTRGPGFAEAVNIIERLIDAAARQCGFDRAELRRINMVPAEAMPMTNVFGNSSGQRRFREDPRSGVGPSRRRRFPGAAGGQRGAGLAARPRLCLSHQRNRRFAARERRHPLRGRRHGVADHRHADHRAGPRDHVSADPGRSPRHPERADQARSGRHRSDPDGRRARQLARDIYGRHRDLACRRRDHRQRHQNSRRRARSGRSRHPFPGRSVRGVGHGSLGIAARCRGDRARERARRSTPTTPGPGNG